MTAYRQGDAPPQDEAARLRRLAREAMDKKVEDIVARFEKMARQGALGGYADIDTEFDGSYSLRDGVLARLKSRGFKAWIDEDDDLQFSWSSEAPRVPWWKRLFGGAP